MWTLPLKYVPQNNDFFLGDASCCHHFPIGPAGPFPQLYWVSHDWCSDIHKDPSVHI